MTTTIATTNPSGQEMPESSVIGFMPWLRGLDLNQRPSGYENSRIRASNIRKSANVLDYSAESSVLATSGSGVNYNSDNYSGGL